MHRSIPPLLFAAVLLTAAGCGDSGGGDSGGGAGPASSVASVAGGPASITAAPGSGPADTGSVEAGSVSSAPATVTVGEVPGNTAAAPAITAWARDLVSEDLAVVQAKCWTIAPENTATMYADKQPILDALAQPGIDGQFAVLWRSATTEVSVKRSEIRSGYACPRVSSVADRSGFDDADARYTVHRFLARATGKPVSAADTEDAYPLICAGVGGWHPDSSAGSGAPVPLASNPDKLRGSTGFDDAAMTVTPLTGDYVTVQVPVTDAAGATTEETFTLSIGSEGRCIGDIQP